MKNKILTESKALVSLMIFFMENKYIPQARDCPKHKCLYSQARYLSVFGSWKNLREKLLIEILGQIDFEDYFLSNPVKNKPQSQSESVAVTLHKYIQKVVGSFKIYTYLIYFPTIDLYKIGRTSQPEHRLRSFSIETEIILIIGGDIEKQWLENISEFKINTGMLPSGNTETFRFNS